MKRTAELKRTPMKPGTKPLRARTAAPGAEPKRRTRKCAVPACRQPFEPRSMTHKACGPACAEALVQLERARDAKKERQAGLAKLKRRADWMREAQAAINAWVRERDRELPCISCGRHHQGQYHAGHYLARGSHPHLALNPLNLAKQCAPCNTHLSGNQVRFRQGLIARIGLAAVEALEADHTPRKYSIDELKAIKAHYVAELKKLKASAETQQLITAA